MKEGRVHPPTQDVRESSQSGVLARNWKGPRQDTVGRKPTKDSEGSLMCAREMGCEGIPDTRQTRAVCVDTAVGGR